MSSEKLNDVEMLGKEEDIISLICRCGKLRPKKKEKIHPKPLEVRITIKVFQDPFLVLPLGASVL